MFDKKEKQLINLVHVIALSALHQANPTHKTETELKKYAFPLELDLWYAIDASNTYQRIAGRKQQKDIVGIAMLPLGYNAGE